MSIVKVFIARWWKVINMIDLMKLK
jgi:hypothetical protein